MILVGLTEGDTEEYIDHVVDKLLNIKLFDDEKGARWKESVKSLGLDLLLGNITPSTSHILIRKYFL